MQLGELSAPPGSGDDGQRNISSIVVAIGPGGGGPGGGGGGEEPRQQACGAPPPCAAAALALVPELNYGSGSRGAGSAIDHAAALVQSGGLAEVAALITAVFRCELEAGRGAGAAAVVLRRSLASGSPGAALVTRLLARDTAARRQLRCATAADDAAGACACGVPQAALSRGDSGRSSGTRDGVCAKPASPVRPDSQPPKLLSSGTVEAAMRIVLERMKRERDDAAATAEAGTTGQHAVGSLRPSPAAPTGVSAAPTAATARPPAQLPPLLGRQQLALQQRQCPQPLGQPRLLPHPQPQQPADAAQQHEPIAAFVAAALAHASGAAAFAAPAVPAAPLGSIWLRQLLEQRLAMRTAAAAAATAAASERQRRWQQQQQELELRRLLLAALASIPNPAAPAPAAAIVPAAQSKQAPPPKPQHRQAVLWLGANGSGGSTGAQLERAAPQKRPPSPPSEGEPPRSKRKALRPHRSF